MGELLERIGVEAPVVQAGMGGGIAGAELAAAVSEAGGLGTIGILPPERLGEEIAKAGGLTEMPVAVNLLLPFATDDHWRAASRADLVVSFWGEPRRQSPTPWLHQSPHAGASPAPRKAALAELSTPSSTKVSERYRIAGTTPAPLIERVRAALPADYPVLLAGAIVDRGGVADGLDSGAEAAVCGTRFLLSEESAAHPEYKRRLLDAEQTILTELFGAGRPAAPHRVVANDATPRWLAPTAAAPGDPRASPPHAGRRRAGRPARIGFALRRRGRRPDHRGDERRRPRPRARTLIVVKAALSPPCATAATVRTRGAPS
ncbi:MAG: NAD(P)H-dependent flavin oxidoreductase [Solirubrobacterales bacterium]